MLKRILSRVQSRALDTIRKWWRPISCIGIAGGVWVYCVVTPLYSLIVLREMPSDGMGIAAIITATAGAFAVREAGKIWGSVDDTPE